MSKRRNSMKQILAKSFARLHMKLPEKEMAAEVDAAPSLPPGISTFQPPTGTFFFGFGN